MSTLVLKNATIINGTGADPLPNGSVIIEGARPYRAVWEFTKITQDSAAREDFSVPPGYRLDLERLLTLQRR